MTTKKQRVLVFDFDGVLADSTSLHIDCWKKVLKDHGGVLTKEVYTSVVGWSPVEIARTLVRKTEAGAKPEQMAQEKQALYQKRAIKELKLMSGAKEALTRLHGEFPIAITASQPNKFLDDLLERLSLRGFCDKLITREDVGAEEELSDLLAVAVAQLSSEPASAVMIDDARNGILAAKRLSMKAIAFDSHPNLQIDYSMADAQVSSLDELVPELVNQVLAS